MGAFDNLMSRAQRFNEAVMGGSFTYGGSAFAGVFNEVEVEYAFEEAGQRRETALTCSTEKGQWVTAGKTPANRGVLTYGGVGYSIFKIDGVGDAGTPSYTLYLKRLT